jgi:t-SNARE complex subunit (syntaxin)
MSQVNEIFQEVAQLVASQQENVDDIESQVGASFFIETN